MTLLEKASGRIHINRRRLRVRGQDQHVISSRASPSLVSANKVEEAKLCPTSYH
jgi:hypothetical protein